MNPVQTLIEFYREKGISLEEIIGDAVFKSLTLDQQVDALRTYASEIQSGMKAPSPIKTILGKAAVGAGLGAIATVLGGNPHIVTKVWNVGGGALLGATIGKLQSNQQQGHYESMNRYLSSLADDKSNAVKAISTQARKPKEMAAAKPAMLYMGNVSPILQHITHNVHNLYKNE